MASMRVQRRSAANLADIAQARLNAISAVEIGANWINDNQSSWRTTYTAVSALGTGIAGTIAMPSGTAKVSFSDPIDGLIINRPTDPVIVESLGVSGLARQKFQLQLNPVGTPVDALRYAISSPGASSIGFGNTLSLTGAPMLSTVQTMVNGSVSGSVQALLKLGLGSISGGWSLPAYVFTSPPNDPIPIYAALGTTIAPGSTLQRQALGPGVSSYGVSDPDGLYVINAGSGTLQILDMRLLGTLVIRGAGATTTISSQVFMSPSRSDYPVLVVEGNLVLAFDGSSGKSLDEGDHGGINFNPPGMPYNGATNATTSDSYPSKICGLIHVRGKLSITGKAWVVGSVMVDSADILSAVSVSSNCQIDYDASLFANPPMGYTKTVQMVPAAGTWAQIVDP